MKKKYFSLLLLIIIVGAFQVESSPIANAQKPQYNQFCANHEEPSFRLKSGIEVYEGEIKDNDGKKAKYYLSNKKTGKFIYVYEGEIEAEQEMPDAREVKYTLLDKKTGRFLNVYVGTLDPNDLLNNPGLVVITPQAVSKPTTIEWNNYTHDWSGTRYLTYTQYAFPSGSFYAWANEPFTVKLYDFETDTYFSTTNSTRKNGRYEIATGGGNFNYYCTLSNKNQGVPMTGAIYKSVPFIWH